jgi:hypothetical protein
MAGRDRSAFARDNAAWLIPAFGAVLLLGILWANPFAMAGGGAGLVWVALAVRARR